MPGPPPKDPAQRRRRNATPGFKLLPRTVTAPAPDWPLSSPATYAEAELWQKLWRLPQAAEWRRMQCEELVALYVSQAIVFLVYPRFRRPTRLEWVAVVAATGLAVFGLEVVISQQPYT